MDFRLSAQNEWMEQQIAARRRSPLFARLASSYLAEGKVDEAIDLCVEGLKIYPSYYTGHLVLGRCHEVKGRTIDALLEYRQALKGVPANTTIAACVERMEKIEAESFRAFAEERTRLIKERKNTIPLQRYLSDEPVEKETTIDFLLKRLKDVKKITPKPAEAETAPLDLSTADGGGVKIVTATLAEIFVSQGEYTEAIDAYRTLIEQQPRNAERFEKRIVEITALVEGRPQTET